MLLLITILSTLSSYVNMTFGKLVGSGMIIIGVAVIVSVGLSYMAVILQQDIYAAIGEVITIVGLVIGLGLNFYAMIKYNKGIF